MYRASKDQEKDRPLKIGRWQVLISKGTYKAYLMYWEDEWISIPVPGILKVYTEALTEFTHLHCPDNLNNTI